MAITSVQFLGTITHAATPTPPYQHQPSALIISEMVGRGGTRTRMPRSYRAYITGDTALTIRKFAVHRIHLPWYTIQTDCPRKESSYGGT
jgi:hypothetical protein